MSISYDSELESVHPPASPANPVSALLALCLLIFHAIVPAPNAEVASGGLRAYESGATSSVVVATVRGEAGGSESVSPASAHHDVVAWVREARPLAGAFTMRSQTAVRSLDAGAASGWLSVEAAFAASVRVRTLDDSHAVSARGALLPYFPTAPPLRG